MCERGGDRVGEGGEENERDRQRQHRTNQNSYTQNHIYLKSNIDFREQRYILTSKYMREECILNHNPSNLKLPLK